MRKFITFFFSFALLSLSFSNADAKTYHYVYQGLNTTHITSKVAMKLFEEVKNRTNGQLDITFLQQGAVVKLEGAYTAVRDGTIESGYYSPSYNISLLPYSQAISAPWLVKNSAHAARVQNALRKAIPEYEAELNKDIVTIAVYSSDRNAFLSNDKQIKTPADLKGKRVLTWAPGLIEDIKSWGATPVMINNADAYVGLQRGLGDVIYSQFPMILPGKLHEVAKYITVIPPSSAMPTCVGFNKGAWNDLPKELQDIFLETAGDLSIKMGDALNQTSLDDIETLKKYDNIVYTLSPEEIEPFQKLSAPAQHKYWVEMIEKNSSMKNASQYFEKVYEIAKTVEYND